MVERTFPPETTNPWRFALLGVAASVVSAAVVVAPWASAARGSATASASSSASQPPGTVTVGPATLATSGSTTLENHPTCIAEGCTFIQFSGTSADAAYTAQVNGTIVAWRIASGSAGNTVKLRVLRPAGGGKYSAVASSPTETTSGNSNTPDQFSASIPIRAGDVIGLDNANSALIFKTGVLGAFPEFWTPALSDGGNPSAPTTPVGTTSNGYQLQIDAYVQPSPTTTSTTTTTTTTATTSTTTATTTTSAPRPETTFTLGNPRLTAVWKASRLFGKVRFTVTVHGASQIAAAVAAPTGGHVWAGRNYQTNRAGTFQEILRLPPETPPGSYLLRVGATTGTAKRAEHDRTLVLKAPPEGVVDQATISLEENGKGVTAVQSPEKELWVRFHFLSLPRSAGKVRIVWRTPSFKLVGAVMKTATATTGSFIRSAVPLASGRWYAILSVDGIVVKRINIRIT